MTFFIIFLLELEYAIRRLKSDKTPGLDRLSSRYLKLTIPEMTPIYINLFNVYVAQGYHLIHF